MFFWAAALFNLLIGIAGMLAPEGTIDARIVGLFIFGFGIVYVCVAREPRRFAPVLWAGVIGKAGVLAVLGPDTIGPNGDSLFGAVLMGDAFFVIGFLTFLLRNSD